MPWKGLEPTIPAFERQKTVHAFFLIRVLGGGVHTGSTRQVGHFWPIVPAPCDCEDGEFGGMKIGRGNRITRRKATPAPLCPPQIPLRPNQGANPSRRGGKPATNRLNYGAAVDSSCLRPRGHFDQLKGSISIL
jgi:hypothetical protein